MSFMRCLRPALFSVLFLCVFCLLPVAPALAVFGDDNNTDARPTEGKVASITVAGNERTDLALVYRIMGLHEGGPFSADLDRKSVV